MASQLIITSVEQLQDEIIDTLIHSRGMTGIYISLNKTQKSIEDILSKRGVDTSRLFFIDCVTSEKTRDDVLHIPPNDLDLLHTSIESFLKEIKSKKIILIDAISTLLIYNDVKNVAQFVKRVTELASKTGEDIIAFSPQTKGEDLLNKIYNFFDEVKEK